MKAYLSIIAVAALVLASLIYFTGGKEESKSIVVLYEAQTPLTRNQMSTAASPGSVAPSSAGTAASSASAAASPTASSSANAASAGTTPVLSQMLSTASESATDAHAAIAAASSSLNAASSLADSPSEQHNGQGYQQIAQTMQETARGALKEATQEHAGELSSLVQSGLGNKSLADLIGMNAFLSDMDKQQLLSGIAQLQAIADEVRAEGNHVPASPMEALSDIIYMYRNLDGIVEQGGWNPETRTNNASSTNSGTRTPATPPYKRGSLNDPNLTKMKLDLK